MLYNHQHLTVWAWHNDASKPESRCPECNGELLPRRGEHVVWHWAHRPGTAERARCSWEESQWHLLWKRAYADHAGYVVEHPVTVGGKKYVIDAYHPTTRAIREFVHSLSPSYVAKHRMLTTKRNSVLWIWDGGEFASKRCRGVAKGGVKRLLKPTAKVIHTEIGGLVHIQHGDLAGMWKHWRHDVWYRHDESQKYLAAFAAASKKLNNEWGRA